MFDHAIETLEQTAALRDTQRREYEHLATEESRRQADACRKEIDDLVSAVNTLREVRLEKWGEG